jgi:hypothetical protein
MTIGLPSLLVAKEVISTHVFHISHHISIHIIHSKIVILFDVHAENNIRERSLTMELVLIVEIVNKCKLVYVAWLSSFDLDSCA